MSRATCKVWRPTGEIHELAGGTVNGWEAYDEGDECYSNI